LTGKLDWSGKSRDEFRALLEGAGAKFCAAITSKTDLIVVGSSPERSRVELAEK
jgi:NAD-dependent DNA ligase